MDHAGAVVDSADMRLQLFVRSSAQAACKARGSELAGGQTLHQQHSCWLSPNKPLVASVAVQVCSQVMHACYSTEGICGCASTTACHQILVRLQLW